MTTNINKLSYKTFSYGIDEHMVENMQFNAKSSYTITRICGHPDLKRWPYVDTA